MSENFQNPPLIGTPYSLQLSLPVVSNAASLPGSVYNFARVSTPAVSTAWLLPTAPGTSFQPLLGSAYLYQHSSTTMLSGVTGQRQITTPTASYPAVFGWDITRGTQKQSSSLGDFTVTVTDQNTAVSSMSTASQYDKTSCANNMVPLYPSLSASLIQGTPSQALNQGHSLSLPYQEGSHVYYYNQNTRGPLLSGELGPYLQSYGPVSDTGSRASAPQPEVVMVLKEVQPTHVLPPASTSGIYYSESAQPITETSFQVTQTTLGMETSLGLQPPSQTFCLPLTPKFPKSCSSRNIQILESNLPPDLEDISVVAPVQTSSNLLALPPAPSQEQKEKRTFDDIKIKPSKPLDANQVPIENLASPLLPLKVPDIHHLLACIDPLGQEEQPGAENTDLGNNSLSLKDQGTLKNGIESSGGFADITTMVEDAHLPQLFVSLNDLDQCKGPEVIKAKDTRAIKLNQEQVMSSVINTPSAQPRKNKRKTSESISGAPKAKIQPKNPECRLGEEVVICSNAASDGAPVNMSTHSSSKPQEASSSSTSKTKSHRKEKTKKSRENNSKKAEVSKKSRDKIKTEAKPITPKMKRKKIPPELSQENFKKPRSCLGMHMLESVQVFHALGKKSDKTTGHSSSRALGNSSNLKVPQPSPAIKRLLAAPHERKGPEKTQVKPQKPDCSAEKECSSPSQYELPPPGKVKLVPLPFPTLDKPRARPVPRRPHSIASPQPAVANSARPGSTNPAQPTEVNSTQPAPASLTGPARTSRPILTNPTRPGLTNPTRHSVPQSAASGPAPYKTSSCTSVQREPIQTAVTKVQSPLKPQNQYLLQDFRFQPIPWRKADVPGPVMSKPITEEQRPEREAMKKKAQQERENAAKYTSLGKLQFFIEREKDMEISRYYGYTI